MVINNVEHVLYIVAGQLCNTEKARTTCCVLFKRMRNVILW